MARRTTTTKSTDAKSTDASAEDYAAKLAALLGDRDPAELDADVRRALGVAHATKPEAVKAAVREAVKAHTGKRAR